MSTDGTKSSADQMMETLSGFGVEWVFGIPGAPLTPIYQALTRHDDMRLVMAKHEGGAAFMANSFARAKRDLSVCIVTSGPGATNAVTGAASAMADSLPVLYVTGQVATGMFGKGAIQESTRHGTDVVEIFRPITKRSVMATDPASLSELVADLCRTALSGRWGPVHLNLPADVAAQVGKLTFRPTWMPGQGLRVSSDPEPITQAALALTAAKQPCILAGNGISHAGAWSELRQLAEHLAIPVATSPKGKGVFPENHPLSLGVFGFGGHDTAHVHIEEADVLLVLGSSLNEFSSNRWDTRLVPKETFIQVDIDPAMISRNYSVDIPIRSDAKAVLRQLLDNLTTVQIPVSPGLCLGKAPTRHEELAGGEDDGRGLHPGQLVRAIRDQLPDDGALCVDIGNSIMWAGHYFEVRTPHTYFVDLGIGSMGSAVAGALGVQLARPQSPVVALVGDSAFAMNGAEVHTASEYGIPVVWIVLNDGGHGMIHHGEGMVLGKDLGYSRFRGPIDVAAMARALGATAFTVLTIDDFRPVFAEALAQPGPAVIDARIDHTLQPPTLARRAASVRHFLADGESPG